MVQIQYGRRIKALYSLDFLDIAYIRVSYPWAEHVQELSRKGLFVLCRGGVRFVNQRVLLAQL